MEEIGFYFTSRTDTIQLPVNPEYIKVTYPGTNKTTEIVKLGQVNILKRKGLADFEFECFFPGDTWFPGITSNVVLPPSVYKQFFTDVMESSQYIKMIISGFNISTWVSVEKFVPQRKAGEHEDMYYSIQLKEYRPYGIQELVYDVPLGGTNKDVVTRPSSKATIGSTVVVNGTLFTTSYGDSPGKSLKDYKGKVNYINSDGSKQYHVTTPDGQWLGWVSETDIKVVN